MTMSNETQTTYQHLEARPHKWRKQLWIKGRNMCVWHLLTSMWAERMTPEEVAKDYGLPVEAALEALDYYEKNKEIVHADAEQEKQWMREHGWKLD
jgi:uncharacterized protein (DUF433 family)